MNSVFHTGSVSTKLYGNLISKKPQPRPPQQEDPSCIVRTTEACSYDFVVGRFGIRYSSLNWREHLNVEGHSSIVRNWRFKKTQPSDHKSTIFSIVFGQNFLSTLWNRGLPGRVQLTVADRVNHSRIIEFEEYCSSLAVVSSSDKI